MVDQSDFDAFDDYYTDAKERIDQRITEILNENEELATKRKLLQHSTTGGKRIRPVLTLLVSEVYDSPYDRAINHASIVEFIHNACVTGDTRVRMASGESTPIRDVSVGDEVMAFNENEQGFVSRKVTHVHENGVKPVVRVETRNRTVTCTPDHEFLVYRKKQPTRYAATERVAAERDRPATDISTSADTGASEGTVQNWLYGATKEWEATNLLPKPDARSVLDEIGVNADVEEVCKPRQTQYESPDVGFEYVEAGLLDKGDVVVAPKQTSTSGEGWDVDLARLAGIIVGDGSVMDHGVSIAVPNTDPCRDWVVDALSDQTDNTVDTQPGCVQVSDVELAERFRDLGLSEPHTDIRIPDWVWHADPDAQRAFAAGIIDADGTVGSDGQVEIGLANHELVRDLKELLDQLGFVTSNIWSREVDTAHIDGSPTTTTRLYHIAVGSHKVLSELSPLSPEYRKRLGSLDRRVTMRHEDDVVFPDGGPDFEEVGFTKVTSIEPVDEPQETFDLRVEGDHNYIADGLVTHNSLIADDRYDEDAMRRGAPTFHKVLDKLPFGKSGHKAITGMSVMGANGLVAIAFQLAKDPDVMNAMGEAMQALIDGFFEEGMSVFSGVFGGGYERYIETNKAKTGGLFALSAWMPATHVDAPEEQVEAARKYGEEVGILYQIADDIADDDLPSFIKDPEGELEKWYDEATGHIEEMPDGDNKELLYAAPAWMVRAMFKQEDIGDEIEVDFLPTSSEE